MFTGIEAELKAKLGKDWVVEFEDDSEGESEICISWKNEENWWVSIEGNKHIQKTMIYFGLRFDEDTSDIEYINELASKEKNYFLDFDTQGDWGIYKSIDSLNFKNEAKREGLFNTDKIETMKKEAVKLVLMLIAIIEPHLE